MGRTRPVIKNNEWQLSKHEYYAAYHYALQYNEWKDMITAIASLDTPDPSNADMPKGNGTSDPTFNKAVRVSQYRDKMKMIEDLVREADPCLYYWLLRGVTDERYTYDYMRMKMNIPCGKNYYGKRRRRFYYLLNEKLKTIDTK